MAKICVLGDTGGGKTTAVAGNKKLGIKGADPSVSYIITSTNKTMGRGGEIKWPTMPNFSMQTTAAQLKDYRRIITNNPELVAHAITLLGLTPIHNIFVDDTNYLMQDMYMEKALSSGWDTPKLIGYKMGKVFAAIERLPLDKNIILMAHGEVYSQVDGRKGYRMKTTGNMVNEFVTPEGKFDITLIAMSQVDTLTNEVKKVFLTRDDGIFTSAKCQGVFKDLYIPNDMGYVLSEVDKFFNSTEDDDEEEDEAEQAEEKSSENSPTDSGNLN